MFEPQWVYYRIHVCSWPITWSASLDCSRKLPMGTTISFFQVVWSGNHFIQERLFCSIVPALYHMQILVHGHFNQWLGALNPGSIDQRTHSALPNISKQMPKIPNRSSCHVCLPLAAQWASCQIREIAGDACAGNAGNVFPRHWLQRKTLVSDPGMHHGTCVTHVPWCMSGSLVPDGGENVPGIPGACAPAIFRIWQEAHGQRERDDRV